MSKTRKSLAGGAVLAVLGYGVVMTVLYWRLGYHGGPGLQHWLGTHTGTDLPGATPAQRDYNFWSGFGSDFGEASLVAAIMASMTHQARIHNCQVRGCWRLGRYPTAGGHYKVCRVHHPEQSVREHGASLEHVIASHFRHKEQQESPVRQVVISPSAGGLGPPVGQ